jgi:phytoene dehydrogenase-like protein
MATRAALSPRPAPARARARPARRATIARARDADVVVVGAGLGGLSAAALLASRGLRVTVLEAHVVAGGAAHAWTRGGYTFESGPSLYSGLEARPTTNPMGQVLHAIDERVACARYNTWTCHLPEGTFVTEVGNDQFLEVLREYVDEEACEEWTRLKALMEPLATASASLPPAAVRSDVGGAFTLARFVPGLVRSAPYIGKIMAPYSKFMAENDIKHPFIRNYMEMLCFLLSGAPASGTMAAEIGYMFDDWYKPNSMLEFPMGGSGAIVDALVRGLKKFGGELELGTHVEEIIVEGEGKEKRATGVRTRDGKVYKANKAVISNATLWDTVPMLPPDAMPREWIEEATSTAMCESFMHLHLGIDAAGLPDDLEIHHIYVEDWDRGVTAEQNMVLVSIPSVLDPSMAPEGKHVIHAYTPGNEPLDIWDGLDRNSDEYKKLKEERSQVLWKAVEKIIPDVRKRCEITMVGTPVTQKRFLRRAKGTYGGTGWISEDQDSIPITSASTPLPGLLVVGDSNFPGPGVPAVAAGGWSAANELISPLQTAALLDKVCPPGTSK